MSNHEQLLEIALLSSNSSLSSIDKYISYDATSLPAVNSGDIYTHFNEDGCYKQENNQIYDDSMSELTHEEGCIETSFDSKDNSTLWWRNFISKSDLYPDNYVYMEEDTEGISLTSFLGLKHLLCHATTLSTKDTTATKRSMITLTDSSLSLLDYLSESSTDDGYDGDFTILSTDSNNIDDDLSISSYNNDEDTFSNYLNEQDNSLEVTLITSYIGNSESINEEECVEIELETLPFEVSTNHKRENSTCSIITTDEFYFDSLSEADKNNTKEGNQTDKEEAVANHRNVKGEDDISCCSSLLPMISSLFLFTIRNNHVKDTKHHEKLELREKMNHSYRSLPSILSQNSFKSYFSEVKIGSTFNGEKEKEVQSVLFKDVSNKSTSIVKRFNGAKKSFRTINQNLDQTGFASTKTKLYQLLESRNWNEALDHIRICPEEVSLWVIGNQHLMYNNDEKNSSCTIQKGLWYLPIHIACVVGAPLNIIQSLLDIDSQAIYKTTEDGKIPLHLACESVYDINPEVLSYLLKKWPDSFYVQNGDGYLPITIAILNNDPMRRAGRVEALLCEFLQEDESWFSGESSSKMVLWKEGIWRKMP